MTRTVHSKKLLLAVSLVAFGLLSSASLQEACAKPWPSYRSTEYHKAPGGNDMRGAADQLPADASEVARWGDSDPDEGGRVVQLKGIVGPVIKSGFNLLETGSGTVAVRFPGLTGRPVKGGVLVGHAIQLGEIKWDGELIRTFELTKLRID